MTQHANYLSFYLEMLVKMKNYLNIIYLISIENKVTSLSYFTNEKLFLKQKNLIILFSLSFSLLFLF